MKVSDKVFLIRDNTKRLTILEPVRIMAVEEGWAMVRYKGCAPFCVMLKELTTSCFGIQTAAPPPAPATEGETK